MNPAAIHPIMGTEEDAAAPAAIAPMPIPIWEMEAEPMITALPIHLPWM